MKWRSKITRPRHPELAGEQEKALEEARRLVKVKHPNVVRAFGAERVGHEIGLSMELVKGHTLDEIVRRQAPFSANEAAVIGIDLCRALAAVHSSRSPSRRHQGAQRDARGWWPDSLDRFGTSRDLNGRPPGPGGDFAGTPLYLAPEVFAGSSRTMQSEIHSVGVLLYPLVTGAYPFEGETRTAIGQLHSRHSPPKPLRDVRPDLPDPFIRVIDRALAEDPSQRFPSAGAMETALAQLLGPGIEPSRNPTPSFKLLLAALTLLVLAVGSLTVWRLGGPSPTSIPSVSGQTGTPLATPTSSAATVATSPTSDDRIEAAFYREQSGSVERLKPGTQVSPNEALSLQVELSAPAYLYVVNEDESGESYLLFPTFRAWR